MSNLAHQGIRLLALRDAAKAVCAACARHAYPDDPMPLHGPNNAGNYCHWRRVGGGWQGELCRASSIWSIVAWEWDVEHVAQSSPRGWLEQEPRS